VSVHGAPPPPRLTLPMGASVLLHGALLGALFLLRPGTPPAMPPVYRVNLIAAPAGPRAIGMVQDKPAVTETKAVTPPKSKPAPKPAPVVAKKPVKAAPASKAATPAPPEVKTKRATSKTPAAGGGPEGGKGADVATVHTPGIDFPFQGYLDNIVRQIALRFDAGGAGAVTATVAFLVHRDGSVTDFRFQKRSGSYAFDLAAQGAIDGAGSAKAFGALPSGYPDDVLPVIFTFDPRIIH